MDDPVTSFFLQASHHIAGLGCAHEPLSCETKASVLTKDRVQSAVTPTCIPGGSIVATLQTRWTPWTSQPAM